MSCRPGYIPFKQRDWLEGHFKLVLRAFTCTVSIFYQVLLLGNWNVYIRFHSPSILQIVPVCLSNFEFVIITIKNGANNQDNLHLHDAI